MLRIAALLAITILFHAPADAAEPDCYRGKLQQSQSLIAAPANYKKKMLILAHGLRAESMPITAEFPLREPFYKALLDEGWLIASTSYRRNGPIIDEAIEDVLQLRDFVIKKYGRPDKIYLMGTSMGGAIGARISETCKGMFDGILCIGPALYLCKSLSRRPAIPMLFLSNRSEVEDPRAYIARLQNNAARPALWIVRRDGHCNVNDDERLEAFRATVAYAETGKVALERDITIGKDAPQSSAVFKDGGAWAQVLQIDPVYGNVHTRYVQADFNKLGIAGGGTFTVRFKNRAHRVFLGSTYSDVQKGELVAFFMHDGHLQIACNLASAAALLGCREGDMICVLKMDRRKK
jgi:dienelactone hydrolase